MKKGRYQFHAQREPWTGSISINMAQESSGGTWVAEALQMRKIEEGEVLPEPLFRLDQASAQALMDELFACGIRPSDGSGSAGQLAATERHLTDMKTLAFHALKVPHG